MSIVLFAAGNFVLMNSPKKEKMFIDELKKRTGTCNRLISFFFKKEMKTILDLHNGIEPPIKLIRRKKPKTVIIKKFSLLVDGVIICSGLTKKEMWVRIDKYNDTGKYYSVINLETGRYAEEFIPF